MDVDFDRISELHNQLVDLAERLGFAVADFTVHERRENVIAETSITVTLDQRRISFQRRGIVAPSFEAAE